MPRESTIMPEPDIDPSPLPLLAMQKIFTSAARVPVFTASKAVGEEGVGVGAGEVVVTGSGVSVFMGVLTLSAVGLVVVA